MSDDRGRPSAATGRVGGGCMVLGHGSIVGVATANDGAPGRSAGESGRQAAPGVGPLGGQHREDGRVPDRPVGGRAVGAAGRRRGSTRSGRWRPGTARCGQSVWSRTARTPHGSKAWSSMSSLASELTGVRWAAGPSQVWPMLARSSSPSPAAAASRRPPTSPTARCRRSGCSPLSGRGPATGWRTGPGRRPRRGRGPARRRRPWPARSSGTQVKPKVERSVDRRRHQVIDMVEVERLQPDVGALQGERLDACPLVWWNR